MQAALDRVMETYRLLVSTLSPEDELRTRRLVTSHLAEVDGDEHALAIEGLRFLRNNPATPRRRK